MVGSPSAVKELIAKAGLPTDYECDCSKIDEYPVITFTIEGD